MSAELNIKPWERMLREPSQMWEAFQEYKSMGANRSLQTIAKTYGWTAERAGKIATKWHWESRVIAMLDEATNKAKREQKRAIEEMNKRHIRAAYVFQNDILEIAKHLDKIIRAGSLSDLSTTDALNFGLKAVTLYNTAVDIERKARGEATQINQNDITSNGKAVKVILPPMLAERDKPKNADFDEDDEFEDAEIVDDEYTPQLIIEKNM